MTSFYLQYHASPPSLQASMLGTHNLIWFLNTAPGRSSRGGSRSAVHDNYHPKPKRSSKPSFQVGHWEFWSLMRRRTRRISSSCYSHNCHNCNMSPPHAPLHSAGLLNGNAFARYWLLLWLSNGWVCSCISTFLLRTPMMARVCAGVVKTLR